MNNLMKQFLDFIFTAMTVILILSSVIVFFIGLGSGNGIFPTLGMCFSCVLLASFTYGFSFIVDAAYLYIEKRVKEIQEENRKEELNRKP